MRRVYYNEYDAFAAAWLRKLIEAGYIPEGDVDERSIIDVRADDLRAYRQCHFFAGIGGWSHALRLAGWPDDREIWTGSCPCQPFSVAGKGKGKDDERHLWPVFFNLIRDARPAVVMGEQVAGKAGYGWFDGVRADLEGEDYAGRAIDIPACSINAPHIRQRLYWVAVADAASKQKFQEQQRPAKDEGERSADGFGRRGLDNSQGYMDDAMRGRHRDADEKVFAGRNRFVDAGRDDSGLADAECDGRQGSGAVGEPMRPASCGDWEANQPFDAGAGFWHDAAWLTGADGKTRRAKPGVRLLAHGLPNRVGRLRGYGNAIVPPLAAEVIKAFMEVMP